MARVVSRVWTDFLFAWDADGQAQPQMLEQWSLSDDGKNFTFTLRDGLLFHDGSPVTTDDVIASLEKYHTGIIPTPKTIWDIAKPTMTKIDDQSFDFGMEISFGLFPWYGGANYANVVPEELATTYTGSTPIPFDEAVGSGPFKLTEWLPGNRVVYDRFTDYIPRSEPKSGDAGSREAYVDRTIFLEVPDMNTKVAALQTGQADFGELIGNDFLYQLQDDPNTTVVIISPDHSPGVFINKSIPPFNNTKARQAAQLAVDYESAMAAFGPPETWQLCHQIYVCGGGWKSDVGIVETFEALDNFKPTQTMLAKAKQLYEEALAEEGFSGPWILLNATDLTHYGSLLVFKDNMEAIGMEVEMPALDWATVAGMESKECDTWQMGVTGWNTYDPITNSGFSDTWKCGWDNVEIQDLMEAFTKAATLEEQLVLIDQIQDLKIREVPYIHFGQLNALNVHRVEVKGYESFLNLSLDGLWFDK